MAVIVAHPRAQHSHWVVRALLEGGMLDTFHTGFFFREEQLEWMPARLVGRVRHRLNVDIPTDKVLSYPARELVGQALARVSPQRLRECVNVFEFGMFDAAVAKRIEASSARIVVGFETSCLHTFRAAKRRGMTCVLDAASVHHAAQTEVTRADRGALGAWRRSVDRRKDEEIELADHVLTLSGYAKQTFTEHGVPERKVHLIHPGASLQPVAAKHRARSEGRFRFLFVGGISAIKGVDLLIEAHSRLDPAVSELVLVGGAGDMQALLRELPANVTYRGRLGRDELAAEYAAADAFVLPSRFDGFGLVVLEAMTAGLPVIVSSHVGAKDCVQEGETGWIFESGNIDALACTLELACRSAQDLPAMGAGGARAAGQYTWDRYKDRIRAFYSAL